MKIILEKEAEDFLEKRSFNIIKRKFIKSKTQLQSIKLKFPLVMKIISSKAIHKTRAGGIIKNIKSITEAESAYNKLKKIKGFQGVLVQETRSGQEIILGLKKTPEFGQTIMLGAGGTKVEELKDTSFRVCPITKTDAKEMINELKIKTINPKQIISNLLKLSSLAKKHPKITELDINPIILNKKGAVIVDARMMIKQNENIA